MGQVTTRGHNFLIGLNEPITFRLMLMLENRQLPSHSLLSEHAVRGTNQLRCEPLSKQNLLRMYF